MMETAMPTSDRRPSRLERWMVRAKFLFFVSLLMLALSSVASGNRPVSQDSPFGVVFLVALTGYLLVVVAWASCEGWRAWREMTRRAAAQVCVSSADDAAPVLEQGMPLSQSRMEAMS